MPVARLRIPKSLLIAVVAAAGTHCGGPSTAPPDATVQRDVETSDVFEAGRCTLDPPPAGRVCETTCWSPAAGQLAPFACEAYCDLPEGGTAGTACYTAGGDRMIDCTREPSDAGFYVFC